MRVQRNILGTKESSEFTPYLSDNYGVCSRDCFFLFYPIVSLDPTPKKIGHILTLHWQKAFEKIGLG